MKEISAAGADLGILRGGGGVWAGILRGGGGLGSRSAGFSYTDKHKIKTTTSEGG